MQFIGWTQTTTTRARSCAFFITASCALLVGCSGDAFTDASGDADAQAIADSSAGAPDVVEQLVDAAGRKHDATTPPPADAGGGFVDASPEFVDAMPEAGPLALCCDAIRCDPADSGNSGWYCNATQKYCQATALLGEVCPLGSTCAYFDYATDAAVQNGSVKPCH